MTRSHEKLLIAALAGIIIAGGAVFAIQPAVAYNAAGKSLSPLGIPAYETFDLRLAYKL